MFVQNVMTIHPEVVSYFSLDQNSGPTDRYNHPWSHTVSVAKNVMKPRDIEVTIFNNLFLKMGTLLGKVQFSD